MYLVTLKAEDIFSILSNEYSIILLYLVTSKTEDNLNICTKGDERKPVTAIFAAELLGDAADEFKSVLVVGLTYTVRAVQNEEDVLLRDTCCKYIKYLT